MKDIFEVIKREGNLKKFEYKNYKCVVVRHPHMLHLCGYVGLTENDPDYMNEYDRIADIDCHGGLTFGQIGINKSDSNLSEDRYWIGFERGHYNDLIPMMDYMMPLGTVYRDMNYVESECKSIVDQLIEKRNKKS
jgi:hypothetical protein